MLVLVLNGPINAGKTPTDVNQKRSDLVLVIASPLRDEDVERLGAACLRRAADLRVVTLAPPIEVALSNRGSRQLRPDEISRSRQMYAEGYATRAFSDLVIGDMTTPEACARQIARHFGLSMQS